MFCIKRTFFRNQINIFCVRIFAIRPFHLCSQYWPFHVFPFIWWLVRLNARPFFLSGFFFRSLLFHVILKLFFIFIKPFSNFLNIFQNKKNKMKEISALLTLFFTFFTTVHSAYNSTGPTWLPSPYFRAGNNRVILTKTSAG